MNNNSIVIRMLLFVLIGLVSCLMFSWFSSIPIAVWTIGFITGLSTVAVARMDI